MVGTYDVTLGNQVMGTVLVSSIGLYWKFVCKCDLCGEVMYDLYLIMDGCERKLGLLIPFGDSFGMETKVSVKQLGEGNPRFIIKVRHGKIANGMISVHINEPFRYLSALEKMYLGKLDGETGLLIREKK